MRSSRTSAMTPQATAPTTATAVQIAIERPRVLVLTACSSLRGSQRRFSSPPWGSAKRPHAGRHGGGDEDDDERGCAGEEGQRGGGEPGRTSVDDESPALGPERLVDDERGEDRRRDECGHRQ